MSSDLELLCGRALSTVMLLTSTPSCCPTRLGLHQVTRESGGTSQSPCCPQPHPCPSRTCGGSLEEVLP